MTKEELINLRSKILSFKHPDDVKKVLPNMGCYDYLYECNRNRLDDVAIDYFGNKITYRNLFSKVDKLAKSLVKTGVKNGDYVAISNMATPEGVIAFLATNKIGAVAHMINIATNLDEIVKQIKSTNSKVFITHDIFYSKNMKLAMDKTEVEKVVVSSLTTSFPLGFNFDKLKFNFVKALKSVKTAVDKDNRCVKWNNYLEYGKNEPSITYKSSSDDEAVIAYTSGSTGISKAVLGTNGAVTAMPVLMSITDQTFALGDTIFNTLPTWILYSLVTNIYDPLCMGVTVALDPLFNPKTIDKRIEMYKFNHWNTIPNYVEYFTRNRAVKKLDLSPIKSISTGGDFLSETVQKRGNSILKQGGSNCEIKPGYGSSEVLGSFSYCYSSNYTIGSVGMPLIGNKIKILDVDNGNALGANETGELYLYSPTMMKKYYGNDEITKETLIPDSDGILWYKTGDLAHISSTGELFIDGRIRRIVMAKDEQGFPTKIIPDKINKEIMKHGAVYKCETITVANKKYINVPVSYIVLKDSIVVTNELINEIKRYCIKNLPSYMVPMEINYVSELPLTKGLKSNPDELLRQYNEEKKKVRKLAKNK